MHKHVYIYSNMTCIRKQGSVLRPLLFCFILVILSLMSLIFRMLMYADNTNLCCSEISVILFLLCFHSIVLSLVIHSTTSLPFIKLMIAQFCMSYHFIQHTSI